jgi:hypothetical protein
MKPGWPGKGRRVGPGNGRARAGRGRAGGAGGRGRRGAGQGLGRARHRPVAGQAAAGGGATKGRGSDERERGDWAAGAYSLARPKPHRPMDNLTPIGQSGGRRELHYLPSACPEADGIYFISRRLRYGRR